MERAPNNELFKSLPYFFVNFEIVLYLQKSCKNNTEFTYSPGHPTFSNLESCINYNTIEINLK